MFSLKYSWNIFRQKELKISTFNHTLFPLLRFIIVHYNVSCFVIIKLYLKRQPEQHYCLQSLSQHRSLYPFTSNQHCLPHCLCCKLDHLVHFWRLHCVVCLTKTKSTMTCLFWGDTSPITALSASFLPITWYSCFSNGWGIIRVMGGERRREG